MSETQPAQVIIQAPPVELQKHRIEEIERRFSLEDQSAAIDLMAHDRRDLLEKAVKQLNDQLSELTKKATQADQALEKSVFDHVENVNLDDFKALVKAMEDLGIGKFEAVIGDVNIDDVKKKVTFHKSVTKYRVMSDESKRTQLCKTYLSPVGNAIEVKLDFKDIPGAEEAYDELTALNKQSKEMSDRATEAREMLIRLPRFRDDLKAELSRQQLSESAKGQQMLEVLRSKVFEGLGNLQIESE